MNKIQLAVIVGIAVAFIAGGSVGMLVGSDGAPPPRHRRGRGPGLTRELDLTPEQQAQMREIWSEVMNREAMHKSRQRRQALQQQCDQAIEALLTDPQREQYRKILADHARAMEEIHRERRRRIEQAVERTRAILTEPQAKKYDELRENRHRGPFRGGRGPGPFGRPRRRGPRTRPAPDAKGGAGTGEDGDRRHAPAGRNEAPSSGSDRPAWVYSYG